MWKKIKRWFLAGIAVVLPVAVTIFVLVWLFNLLDGILRDLIDRIFGINIPGLGLLALLIIIFLVGLFASNLLGNKVTGWFEKIIGKIPLIKSVYNPVRKITSGLSGEKAQSFQKVVLVEFPQKGHKSIGFITNSDFSVDEGDNISVFVPTTPNPTNGFLIIMDQKDVQVLDMTVNEGLNAVVSIGSVLEGDIKFKKDETDEN